ncbi:hypothetical protein AAG570_013298 [Ranatra chinensis]|uniref:Uncharacterized protein n=1 Tax=Ranatra chinensis TaxID=642074 RepID=A0ABD0YGK2_9HEMI
MAWTQRPQFIVSCEERSFRPHPLDTDYYGEAPRINFIANNCYDGDDEWEDPDSDNKTRELCSVCKAKQAVLGRKIDTKEHVRALKDGIDEAAVKLEPKVNEGAMLKRTDTISNSLGNPTFVAEFSGDPIV